MILKNPYHSCHCILWPTLQEALSQGAAFMLTGTTLAAVVAFTIARRTGGGQSFLAEEGGDSDAKWRQVSSS